ncbi:hypothetical protein [Chitinimonas sp. BJB300]|uniref:hypothetical protein n=1 Tax=Chitinimonas sp. BJB300 TaxID=1559339 RepID=UPI000C0E9BF5|nr:hypothetical protein [Chitinimonas sp. BJB300]PHV11232.1 hypothetical protein CSQ89_11870 [Chitinimonas sp. BJB300]TSJ88624.1 hypothetical protein FG002_010730 [Chitinimonas sp. BJB300]
MVKAAAIISALISMTSFAYDGVLLSKTTNSGYGMPSTSSNCEIYANKVVLTHSSLGVQVVNTKNISLTGDLKRVMSFASRGPFETQIAPVDGPTATYYATLANGDMLQRIDLLIDAGNGVKRINKSEASFGLRSLIDKNCS